MASLRLSLPLPELALLRRGAAGNWRHGRPDGEAAGGDRSYSVVLHREDSWRTAPLERAMIEGDGQGKNKGRGRWKRSPSIGSFFTSCSKKAMEKYSDMELYTQLAAVHCVVAGRSCWLTFSLAVRVPGIATAIAGNVAVSVPGVGPVVVASTRQY